MDNPISAREELWVMTSRLQKVIAGTLRNDEVNFRILVTNVQDAVSGTKCKGNGRLYGGSTIRKQAKYPI